MSRRCVAGDAGRPGLPGPPQAVPRAGSFRSAMAALLAGSLLLAQGCIVIPLDHVTDDGFVAKDAISGLREGRASRVDVLMRLGEPDRRYLEDRVFGYRWTEMLAVVLFGGPGAAGAFDVSETRMLLVEFDADGRVRRADVLHAVRETTIEERIREWLAQVP